MVSIDPASFFYDWECKQFLRRQMEDIGFYRSVAEATGGPVLELGCGTGRVTIPLAEAGFDVTGLDLNPAMLERAEAKARAGQEKIRGRIEFIQGDMCRFDLGRQYPLVLIPYNSFQVLRTQAEQRACLERISAHLAPGGLLAMEITPFMHQLRESPATRKHLATDYLDDGSVVAMYETISHEIGNQLTHFDQEYRVFREGEPPKIFQNRLTLRTVYRFEMELLFEVSGLRVKALYGNYRRGDYPDPEVGGMLYLAGK